MNWGKVNMGPTEMENVGYLLASMEKGGIYNPYLQAAILGVIGKESGFIPQEERCYNNTSLERIREIFSSKLSGYTDSEVQALKQNCVEFFNIVYGGKYGNGPNEGYKYRGRGFNQITFKANYRSIGAVIGENLVSNPDLLLRPDVAADASVAFFNRQFRKSAVRNYVPSGNPNDVTDLDTAIELAAHANAGFGKNRTSSSVVRAIGNTAPIADVALAQYIGVPPAGADPTKSPTLLPPIQYAGVTLDSNKQLLLLGAAVVFIGIGILGIRRTKKAPVGASVVYSDSFQ